MMVVVADASNSAAPWWAIPVVAGAFAIGGVVASQVVALVLDNRKSKREDTSRWLAERRRIYAAYVAGGEDVFGKIHRSWLRKAPEWTELLAAANALVPLRHEVNLVASKPVRDAGGALWQGILDGIKTMRAEDKRTEKDQGDFWHEYRELEAKFFEAARQELGVD